MLKLLAALVFVTYSFLFLPANAKEHSYLTINIISRNLNNEAGKEVDVEIIKEQLEKLGHRVHLFDYLASKHLNSADINIFLAQFKTSLFSSAKLNWFIPNADFCVAPPEDIQKFDLVLCKTEESLRIFQPYSKRTYFLGFTSLDCFKPTISKDFSCCLHLAGKSIMKGTEEVLKVWKNDPEMEKLVLIKRDANALQVPKNVKLITKRLSRQSLTKLQNSCGIHLCPSKTEGFGHYIMEAMSAGAVVITTDAPPMNEFIKDARCLVRYKHTSQQNYATTYSVDEKALAETIQNLQHLSDEELQNIGQCNRQEYLRRTSEFKQNFEQLMRQAVKDLH